VQQVNCAMVRKSIGPKPQRQDITKMVADEVIAHFSGTAQEPPSNSP
jgi:hypothetical protein